MRVNLIYYSPLWVCVNGIRMSHDSFDKSDTYYVACNGVANCNISCPECGSSVKADEYDSILCAECGYGVIDVAYHIGKKDKELLERIGNKLKHKSVLEQLVYWFEIDGISRACLQELARHRTARMVVKSTRYTLKQLKNDNDIVLHKVKSMTDGHEMEKLGFEVFTNENLCLTGSRYSAYKKSAIEKYLVFTGNKKVDLNSVMSLISLKENLSLGIGNDIAKYSLPEAFKTKLQWQIDGRNLQNFLELRSSRDALWEIRKLACTVFDKLPDEHRYLYDEFVGECKQGRDTNGVDEYKKE